MKGIDISGKPIDIYVGDENQHKITIYPTKVFHYEELQRYLGMAGLQSYELHDILEEISYMDGLDARTRVIHEQIMNDKLTVFDTIKLVNAIDMHTDITDILLLNVAKLFELTCKNMNAFELLASNEQYEDFLDVVRAINKIKYKKPSPNPEIRYLDELKAKSDALKGNQITFDVIFSTIMVEAGMTASEINDMTIYQFISAFERIQHFKAFEVSSIAAILGGGEIHPWYATEKEEKPKTISHADIYSGVERDM